MRSKNYSELSNLRVAVLGFGVTGQSAAEWLINKGASVLVYEEKDESCFPHKLIADLRSTGNFYFTSNINEIVDINFAITSPGIDMDSPIIKTLKNSGVSIETDISLFLRLWNEDTLHPTIGVTGSNGKSTIVSLLAHILTKSGFPALSLGNIGNPPLPTLNFNSKNKPIPILEMSSYQLEHHPEDAPMPNASIISNLSSNHLDRHGDMESYARAKCEIVSRGCRGVVVDFDDGGVSKYIFPILKKKKIPIWAVTRFGTPVVGANKTIFLNPSGEISIFNDVENRKILNIRNLPESLRSPHNLINVGLVIGVLDVVGFLGRLNKNAFYGFKNLPHRIELIDVKKGVSYIDDSKATSPAAVNAALLFIDGPIVWIAGGGDKEMEYDELSKEISKKVRVAVLLPGTAENKLQVLLEKSGVLKVISARDVVDAVSISSKIAKWGETVLLSPGTSASGAGYESFNERGDKFSEAVRALPA